MLKKILIGLLAVLIIIQFFRPEKNESNDQTYAISTKYNVPNDVDQILAVSCYDCHSNKTRYPWYFSVQPVAWWMNDHISEGKRHLNLSAFTRMPIAFQNRKFKGIVYNVEKKHMPISSYTYLGMHSDANLSDEQRQTVIDWAKSQMDYLKANYPADSLKMPERRPRPPKDDD